MTPLTWGLIAFALGASFLTYLIKLGDHQQKKDGKK